MNGERRRAARRPYSCPVQIRSDRKETAGVTWDVSENGLGLGSFDRFQVGESIVLTLYTQKTELEGRVLRGRVVHRAFEPERYPWRYRLGVQLDDLSLELPRS